MVKTTLSIDGMMCSMCEAHVNDVIRRSFTVKSVKSSHKKGTCEIVSDEAPAEDQLSAALEGIGCHLLSMRSEPYVKKGLFSFGK